ncbi:MAG: tRNA 2-selenouridine(34) synthase MnmH [Zetaproteobacteria bacterium]|nr:tRNA 2-selenouridine(34) synthase MnmH [Pseudobdellovibrionaceae bacterium]
MEEKILYSEKIFHNRSAAQSIFKMLPIVDLRSEKEWLLGHIPKSVNIPILNNYEREKIGTLYKEHGKIDAVSSGLNIFSEKCVEFLKKIDVILSFSKSYNKKILIYCWRGGLRSKLVYIFLSSCGYEPYLLYGGYKSYRSFVLSHLDKLAARNFLVLHGLTGVGKTEFLNSLNKNKQATLDFEKLAGHRGSAFGDFGLEGQAVSQQNFENNLVQNFINIGEEKLIFVEFEGVIGPVALPEKLRKKLKNSPMIYLEREKKDRVARLVKSYCLGWNSNKEKLFLSRLKWLQKKISKSELKFLIEKIKKKEFAPVVDLLLSSHYDRVYLKSLRKYSHQNLTTLNLTENYSTSLNAVIKSCAEQTKII